MEDVTVDTDEIEYQTVKEMFGEVKLRSWKGFSIWRKILALVLIILLCSSIAYLWGYKTGTGIASEHYLKEIDRIRNSANSFVSDYTDQIFDDEFKESLGNMNFVNGTLILG